MIARALALLALLALSLLALFALSGCKPEADGPPPVRPVLSIKAEPRTRETLGPFAGSIQPRYSADYSFRVFGRVVSRPVNVGSIVSQGDELASIDPSVQAILVRNTEAAVAGAEAQLINARGEEARQRPLVERNITPQAQFDAVVQSREAAEANLARARTSLAYTRLRADFAGIVTAVYVDAGQVVNVGQKIMTLARPEVREAVIALPPALAEQLAAGETFEMRVDLDPDGTIMAAGVRAVDPAADAATRTRNVYLSLSNPPDAFRLGITVQVTLSKPVSPRVDLPATALLEQNGKAQVWIVDLSAHKVALRDVIVLSRSGDQVAVTGLGAGDRVVTVGVHSLTAALGMGARAPFLRLVPDAGRGAGGRPVL
ncbi:MAG: efflux RND transporter periplasmic adaptor subunit [Alphaproteobacteria bacterium]|nr:MAG: efflux RND transporter periplasmic adaptor subunit [Alphaproteobacteria bacterium]